MSPVFVRTAVATTACATGLLLAGCGSDDDDRAASTATQTVTTQQQTESGESQAPTSTPEAALDLKQAASAAKRAAPGSVVSADREDDDGALGPWKVTVSNNGSGTEVKIDATNGTVLSTSPDDLDTEERTAPKVTVDEAIDIAVGKVPGTATEASLDDERSTRVWEVKVQPVNGPWQKVVINAADGSVIRTETED